MYRNVWKFEYSLKEDQDKVNLSRISRSCNRRSSQTKQSLDCERKRLSILFSILSLFSARFFLLQCNRYQRISQSLRCRRGYLWCSYYGIESHYLYHVPLLRSRKTPRRGFENYKTMSRLEGFHDKLDAIKNKKDVERTRRAAAKRTRGRSYAN